MPSDGLFFVAGKPAWIETCVIYGDSNRLSARPERTGLIFFRSGSGELKRHEFPALRIYNGRRRMGDMTGGHVTKGL